MGKASRKKRANHGSAAVIRAKGEVLISVVGESEQRTTASFARMALEANNIFLLQAVECVVRLHGESIFDYEFEAEHTSDGQSEIIDIFWMAYACRAFECLHWLSAKATNQDSVTFAKFAIEFMGEVENLAEDDIHSDAVREGCMAVLRGSKEAADTDLAMSLFDLVRRAGKRSREILLWVEGEIRSRDESVELDAVILSPAPLRSRAAASARL